MFYYELKTGPVSVGTCAKVCKYFKPNQSHFPMWVGQVSGKDAFTAKPWENLPFSTFPICHYSSHFKCQQLLEQGYNPRKLLSTCLTFSTWVTSARLGVLLLYSLLWATLNFETHRDNLHLLSCVIAPWKGWQLMITELLINHFYYI